MKKFLLSTVVSSVILSTTLVAKEKIVVFHAGSLAVPFSQIEKEFEKLYPQYDVQREASGSRAAARKISEIGRAADVMASADYKVIDNLLIPNHAKFNALFATNEMAIAYTPNSKYANEINSKNWPEIFLKEGVKVGHSNPNLDPCGYRSVIVTKLAEEFYKIPDFYNKLLGYGTSYKVGEENKDKVIVRPKETDLLGLIEANAYDYLFIYKSVAQQHGLKYISLPKEVSLVDNENIDFYKKASFDIDGKEPGTFITKKGAPMVYGLTIAQNSKSPANKQGAIKFVNFILSSKGQEIMKQNGQGVINPAIFTGDSSILGK
ncbi:tungstate ABC transporter substrate-binding protein WtpA [Malaciobacter mytili]|uniref:Tungstate ABC transporter substrate-binding protein WtpA n=1 Tax=Malaciobacter mytili LMG 24559 TaxID=1032238 RepID=A0AAX2AKN2_9BACT|nr:tungstate ABC transporter substrate-binding protein WtpA [Malaciobacter mytili]AXH14717.1 molybdate/sulfate/tungstate ABC transporter, periplasmic substrate-binding protein [Malaciobacter mytili LMG 24559]RXI48319.1 tungstate ABC transporter substrate-binding protein WtpA [Malaciobacter mytili]RXK16909.1 tungstate ABC transporter substrate-binding protein WtpA [Malaciobacter mytili LMG 24559]